MIQTQIARIQKLLNFGARVISGRRKFDHVSDVLRDLHWLSAQNLYRYHSMTLLKRIIATGEPEALHSRIVLCGDVHGRETRQGCQFQTPSIRTESDRRRFLYSAVRDFNALPPAIRGLDPMMFKSELRQYLLST